MPKRVFKFYQRKRVININVNIFAAGIFSIAISKYPVAVISGMVGHDRQLLISVLAYAIDTTIDIFIYFGLHWIANHWRPLKQSHIVDKVTTPAESRTKNFLVDVGRVQAERFALVPIFAVIAIGLTWSLQKHMGLAPDWAFVYGFIIAMIITRIIHTVWGYRSGTFKDRHHPDDAQSENPQ